MESAEIKQLSERAVTDMMREAIKQLQENPTRETLACAKNLMLSRYVEDVSYDLWVAVMSTPEQLWN